MPLRITLALALLIGLWPGSVARAEVRPYRLPHPLDLEGNWHAEERVHVHDDLPVGLDSFADVDGVMVFLGDPAAFGYAGTIYSYVGVHPLPASVGGYCGIHGPHSHAFTPEGRYRRDAQGRYAFAGALRGGVRTYIPGRVEPALAVRPAAAANVAAPAWLVATAYGPGGSLLYLPIPIGALDAGPITYGPVSGAGPFPTVGCGRTFRHSDGRVTWTPDLSCASVATSYGYPGASYGYPGASYGYPGASYGYPGASGSSGHAGAGASGHGDPPSAYDAAGHAGYPVGDLHTGVPHSDTYAPRPHGAPSVAHPAPRPRRAAPRPRRAAPRSRRARVPRRGLPRARPPLAPPFAR
ncbi:MAG: hypothetical protein GXP55_01970 [Deltaproteobacteria bacterium]|nr:hypothetical protein [Deltaproteobacteria bacterium]